MSSDEIGQYSKRHTVAQAEEFLRLNAKILVVGTVEDLMNTQLPTPVEPKQKYLLAVMEVE